MLSTDCILFLRTCRAVFSWGLSHPCGGGVSDCISSVNKAANRGWKRTFLSRGIILTCWEIISHWVFCVQMSTARSPKQPHANPRPLPPVFNLRLDKDKLVLRTNSIITNNPRCWQPHKRSLDEWAVYLLECTQRRVWAWPAKMPLHYEATERGPPPPFRHRRLEIPSCFPQQLSDITPRNDMQGAGRVCSSHAPHDPTNSISQKSERWTLGGGSFCLLCSSQRLCSPGRKWEFFFAPHKLPAHGLSGGWKLERQIRGDVSWKPATEA